MNGNRNLLLRLSILSLAFVAYAATARAHEGHHHDAMGTVKAVDAARLDLETTEGKVETFVLTAETTYKRGDAEATHHDVAVGDRAVVTYETKGGKNTAIEVKLGAKKASAHDAHHAPTAPTPTPPPSPTLALAERFGAALRSGDRVGALACLAPDVVIFEHGGAELARDDYAREHLGGDIEYLQTTETKLVDRRVLDGGNRVVVLTRSETRGEFKGKPVASSGTETLVLERRAGGWTIVHVHWSSHKL